MPGVRGMALHVEQGQGGLDDAEEDGREMEGQ